MIWTIGQECFVASHNGSRFELGEMRLGHWILKHWKNSPQSTWYDVTSPEQGKALAEELAE